MIELQVLTQSQLSAFRNCRQLAYWRYEEELVPIREDENLHFGRLMHELLAEHYRGGAPLMLLDRLFQAEMVTSLDRAKARGMMIGYREKYQVEDWIVLAVEKEFHRHPILNPATGFPSTVFGLSGKGDLVVEKAGQHNYLVEHKTTSRIDGGYIEKLWCDYQILVYAKELAWEMGITIHGVIYNILEKPQLKQYEVNKSHPNGESIEDFCVRCTEAMREPGKFHREEIIFSETDYAQLLDEQWELQKAYRDCQLRNRWYKNRDYCWHWNKPCAYWKLCISGGSEIVRASDYRHQKKHSELEPSVVEEKSTF